MPRLLQRTRYASSPITEAPPATNILNYMGSTNMSKHRVAACDALHALSRYQKLLGEGLEPSTYCVLSSRHNQLDHPSMSLDIDCHRQSAFALCTVSRSAPYRIGETSFRPRAALWLRCCVSIDMPHHLLQGARGGCRQSFDMPSV
jgi:hypothetical protein